MVGDIQLHTSRGSLLLLQTSAYYTPLPTEENPIEMALPPLYYNAIYRIKGTAMARRGDGPVGSKQVANKSRWSTRIDSAGFAGVARPKERERERERIFK